MPTRPQQLLLNFKRNKRKNEQKESKPNRKKLNLDDILIKTPKEAEGRIKHHLFPGFNLCQEPLSNLSELQNFPNCEISVPQPVHVAPHHCERIDICHRRTIARAAYRKRLFMGRSTYQTAVKKNRKIRKLQKKNIYHSCLFDLAARLERNPDPYFNGSFDYFYTGGNLCVLPERCYVVHVGGTNLQNLYISRFSSKKQIPDTPLLNLCIDSKSCTSEIMEVKPFLCQHKNRTNCFLTRQKNVIKLHSFKNEEKLKTLTEFRSGTTPFISFAQSEGDLNQIVVTNLKQHLRIYDIETGKPSIVKIHNLGGNNNDLTQWNTIKQWRENTYLYANYKELYLMDLRTSSKEWLKNACGFGEYEFFCENISSLALSEFENLFYVGASHKLYCLDVRNWQRTFENKNTVCRWLHQLEYPPLMLETFRYDNSEFIPLCSPVADQLHICELIRSSRVQKASEDDVSISDGYIYKSPSLPYQPPTLMEAYNHARLSGKCLRPEADLERRLGCCTTGLSYYMNPQSKHKQELLLTSNSNGDVFGHKLSKRCTQAYEPRISAFTDDIVRKYEDKICESAEYKLNYTDVVEMKGMGKILRCSALNTINDDEVKPMSLYKLGGWQKSLQALHNFKDTLAQDILSIWDIEYNDDTNEINLSNLPKPQRVPHKTDEKVCDWLQSNSSIPMTSIPLENLDISTFSTDVKLKNSSALLDKSFSLNAYDAAQSTQLQENSIVQELDLTIENQDLPNNSSTTTTKFKTKKSKKTCAQNNEKSPQITQLLEDSKIQELDLTIENENLLTNSSNTTTKLKTKKTKKKCVQNAKEALQSTQLLENSKQHELDTTNENKTLRNNSLPATMISKTKKRKRKHVQFAEEAPQSTQLLENAKLQELNATIEDETLLNNPLTATMISKTKKRKRKHVQIAEEAPQSTQLLENAKLQELDATIEDETLVNNPLIATMISKTKKRKRKHVQYAEEASQST